jgi:hydrogenase/urease accessory protein HupE
VAGPRCDATGKPRDARVTPSAFAESCERAVKFHNQLRFDRRSTSRLPTGFSRGQAMHAGLTSTGTRRSTQAVFASPAPPPLKPIVFAIVISFIALANAQVAHAHDARPLSINIVERPPHSYRVDVRVPPSVDAGNQPSLIWPSRCQVQSEARRDADGAGLETVLVTCAGSLEGQRIAVRYALFNPSLSTLFRFTPASGTARTAVVPPDRGDWVVPDATSWKTVARDYLILGVEHIWAGIDHLLFVAGLLLLARTPRRIALAITGFTLAHSITLSLSTLGVVRVPIPPIEAGIALSILFLASEVARPDPQSLARRYPLAISSLFGLLHGFGFAAALNEAGLPRDEIPAALLFFNAGVEVGQLAFIAALLIPIACARAVATRMHVSGGLTYARAQLLGAYALGIPASFWFFERVSAFWRR